jgi:hypothetical protein
MNTLVSILRKELVNLIHRIDDGSFDLTDDEVPVLVTSLRDLTNKEEKISKYQACSILHVSRATFDNLVLHHKIPEGRHQQGFKEKFWLKKDLLH